MYILIGDETSHEISAKIDAKNNNEAYSRFVDNCFTNTTENPIKRVSFIAHGSKQKFGELTPEELVDQITSGLRKLPSTVETIDLIACNVGLIQNSEPSYLAKVSELLHSKPGYENVKIRGISYEDKDNKYAGMWEYPGFSADFSKATLTYELLTEEQKKLGNEYFWGNQERTSIRKEMATLKSRLLEIKSEKLVTQDNKKLEDLTREETRIQQEIGSKNKIIEQAGKEYFEKKRQNPPKVLFNVEGLRTELNKKENLITPFDAKIIRLQKQINEIPKRDQLENRVEDIKKSISGKKSAITREKNSLASTVDARTEIYRKALSIKKKQDNAKKKAKKEKQKKRKPNFSEDSETENKRKKKDESNMEEDDPFSFDQHIRKEEKIKAAQNEKEAERLASKYTKEEIKEKIVEIEEDILNSSKVQEYNKDIAVLQAESKDINKILKDYDKNYGNKLDSLKVELFEAVQKKEKYIDQNAGNQLVSQRVDSQTELDIDIDAQVPLNSVNTETSKQNLKEALLAKIAKEDGRLEDKSSSYLNYKSKQNDRFTSIKQQSENFDKQILVSNKSIEKDKPLEENSEHDVKPGFSRP